MNGFVLQGILYTFFHSGPQIHVADKVLGPREGLLQETGRHF